MTIYRVEIGLENMVSIFLTKLHNNDISDVRKDIDYNYAPFYLHIDQLGGNHSISRGGGGRDIFEINN